MKTYVATALLMGFLLLAPTGCVSQPQTQMKTAFSLKDFEPYKAKGLGKIYGQAFLKTRGGDVKVGAGDKVVLWPFPPFMKEVISLKDQGYSITNYTQEMVQQMLPYVRESIGDAQGTDRGPRAGPDRDHRGLGSHSALARWTGETSSWRQ